MIRFGTAGIRGPVATSVTPEAVASIARAAATEGDTWVLGRDGRLTGDALVDAAAAGLASGGANVTRLGILPTPALAFASQGGYGLMVTASHNPPTDNGVKLFVDGREFDTSMEERVEGHIEAETPPVRWDAWGRSESQSVCSVYQQAIEQYLNPGGQESSYNVSVVLDPGCGTAGLVAPSILREAGASVRTLNGTVDGAFPARPSKPTPETIGTLRDFVASGPADIGFAFDGDADRLVVVDESGDVVHEDTILAIMAEHYVTRSEAPDPVVVTTPNASNRIDDRVAAVGGRTVRTPLGQLRGGMQGVVESGGSGTDVVFAAEPWKHIHPAFGGWIDGIVSAGVLTMLIGDTTLRDLRDPIKELPYRKRSVDCPDATKSTVMSTLSEELPAAFPEGDIDTAYGLRMTFSANEWALVRPSGTEPKIRLYVESPEATDLARELEDMIREAVDRHASNISK